MVKLCKESSKTEGNIVGLLLRTISKSKVNCKGVEGLGTIQ